MQISRSLALGSATVALALVPTGAALAAGPSVTVRVEGRTRTLLAPTVVHAETGSITKGGTPSGTCPASSAAGALDRATHHNWTGTYSSGIGIEVTKILGETHVYSAKGFYWGIWVDNKVAQAGACDLKLHRGEQILFAPVPGKGSVSLSAITAPKKATVKRAFTIKVVSYTAAGKPKPLAKATVRAGSTTATTGKAGTVTVTPKTAGKLKITASEKGYIRPVPVTVKVA